MQSRVMVRRLVVAFGLLLAGSAWADDPCPALAQQQSDPQVATRIAAIACAENLRWKQPFIDSQGRLASASTYEAESSGLADGSSPWRRVAYYWQSSGLLRTVAQRPGALDCDDAGIDASRAGLSCRAFVIDTPWSAAFISWVAERAGVPGFTSSASHFDYVRAARANPARSPYDFVDPRTARLATGDMICYVRSSRLYGMSGLAAMIDRGGAAGLPMHCDFVVGTDGGHAYTIGGNVQQAVTMRVLDINAAGQVWGLPQRGTDPTVCAPDQQASCSFNRQDWAVVLKLKPQEALARIGTATPPGYLPPQDSLPQAAPSCCVNCVLGSGVPRCPVPGTTTPSSTPPTSPEPAAEPVQGSD